MAASVFVSLLVSGPYGLALGRAAEATGVKEAGPSPVVITARSLLADNKKRTVVYRDDVVVKKDDLTLYADQVVVNLAGRGQGGKPGKGEGGGPAGVFGGPGKIESIEARGGVKIVQQDKTITAKEAVYYADGEKIVLTGEPRVWQGENVLTGSKITYSLREDTVTVEDARSILYQGTAR